MKKWEKMKETILKYGKTLQGGEFIDIYNRAIVTEIVPTINAQINQNKNYYIVVRKDGQDESNSDIRGERQI